MAHEELKALYEIDKQHSETPWEFWQYRSLFPDWCNCVAGGPEWALGSQYRRKPGAPVWPKKENKMFGETLFMGRSTKEWSQAEVDARKWRELVAFCENGPRTDEAVANKVDSIINPQPELIQGYTREQWQRIIDEGFLCEFADDFSKGFSIIASLALLDKDKPRPFVKRGCDFRHWFKECRPLRTKGVRQPWFGGKKSPVNKKAYVLAKYKSGTHLSQSAGDHNWPNVTEFIEL